MTQNVKILVVAGSLRKGAYSKMLARAAAAAVRKTGATATLVELNDYPMPFYDGDLEDSSGIPENGAKFKKLMEDHDGFIFATPEYNSSYSAVLKNAIDWASRAPQAAFQNKYAAIMAASPGALGGLRVLFALRELLQNLGVTVLPDMRAVGFADKVLSADGAISDEKVSAAVDAIAARLVDTLRKLKT